MALTLLGEPKAIFICFRYSMGNILHASIIQMNFNLLAGQFKFICVYFNHYIACYKKKDNRLKVARKSSLIVNGEANVS